MAILETYYFEKTPTFFANYKLFVFIAFRKSPVCIIRYQGSRPACHCRSPVINLAHLPL